MHHPCYDTSLHGAKLVRSNSAQAPVLPPEYECDDSGPASHRSRHAHFDHSPRHALPSRGESPRPKGFSHRRRDEKSLVC